MKRIVWIALLCGGIASSAPLAAAEQPKNSPSGRTAQARTADDPKLVWTASQVVLVSQEVAPGIYAVFPDDAEARNKAGVPAATSGGFIVGNDGVMVIDAMLNRRLAGQMQGLIAKRTAKPIRYVVNTSYHGDHSYGNQFFPKDVQIVQHVETRRYIESHFTDDVKFMKRYFGADQGLDELKPRRANLLLHDGAVIDIDLGGKGVQVMHLGFAQTPGDLFVWLPDEKVLFTGNPLIASPPALPWLLDGHLEDSLATMRRVRALVPAGAIVVPGHGAPVDVKSIDFAIAYLEQLKREVQAAIARGLSEQETVDAVPMKEYASYKIFPWVHAQINVPKAYQELKQPR